MSKDKVYTELLAIALTYDEKSPPKVVAKGKGEIATEIIKIAKDNNIPIHNNKELAAILSLLEIDDVIPKEAFLAVAKIIAYIYTKMK